ncbi:uncharacterized protein LAJ45_08244 [Morchella importuna]|uniref:uncharacterized protein n=1 Tax=Morchella importuna TaxID=1174673 RepID=UPI001E8E99B7|nr:uncharacterized protein LAJ45_08244 [Morchella importuna]KAH8147778.1 hypothetical protein LAJ45_08244 [Morchella importuna]
MIVNLEIRHDTATAAITASPDDSSLVSTLIPLIQPTVPYPPTKWDLCFGSVCLLPTRTLLSYHIHDGANLWVRPRAHSLDTGVFPLTLRFKQAGGKHTVQLALTTEYTVDAVKRELRMVVGETRSTGFCLYRKRDEAKRGDVERGLEVGAEEEMRRGVEMEAGKTLGSSVTREVRRKARKAKEKAKERVKGLKGRYRGKNVGVRNTDGGVNDERVVNTNTDGEGASQSARVVVQSMGEDEWDSEDGEGEEAGVNG